MRDISQRINVMLSEAKHPGISLKENAETLRYAQGDRLSPFAISSSFFRYTTLEPIFMLCCHAESAMSYSWRSAPMGSVFVARRAGI
jgi:hypothetical protein